MVSYKEKDYLKSIWCCSGMQFKVFQSANQKEAEYPGKEVEVKQEMMFSVKLAFSN